VAVAETTCSPKSAPANRSPTRAVSAQYAFVTAIAPMVIVSPFNANDPAPRLQSMRAASRVASLNSSVKSSGLSIVTVVASDVVNDWSFQAPVSVVVATDDELEDPPAALVDGAVRLPAHAASAEATARTDSREINRTYTFKTHNLF